MVKFVSGDSDNADALRHMWRHQRKVDEQAERLKNEGLLQLVLAKKTLDRMCNSKMVEVEQKKDVLMTHFRKIEDNNDRVKRHLKHIDSKKHSLKIDTTETPRDKMLRRCAQVQSGAVGDFRFLNLIGTLSVPKV